MLSLLSAAVVNRESALQVGIDPRWAPLAMLVTQDIALKLQFRQQLVLNPQHLPHAGPVVLAPTHRARWDALMLPMAAGRRVTGRDCRFMVTTTEMRGLQGCFLQRLGCFPVNQRRPSMTTLRLAIDLLTAGQQLVVFPEGQIQRTDRPIRLHQGLVRLVQLAQRQGLNVPVIPVGIGYGQAPPRPLSRAALCFGEPMTGQQQVDGRPHCGSIRTWLRRCIRLNKRPVQQWAGLWSPFKVRVYKHRCPMGCRSLLSATALVASLGLAGMPVVAQQSASNDRVLAQKTDGFNPAAVQAMINRGDAAAAAGDLAKARQEYDNARKASKQLLAFYRDLSGAFRGLDARIPREMDTKGREALGLLAETNLRLAALFRRQNQPEVAVPVLVEVVKLMTPAQPQGRKAYQSLLELGFVDTEFKGAAPAGS